MNTAEEIKKLCSKLMGSYETDEDGFYKNVYTTIEQLEKDNERLQEIIQQTIEAFRGNPRCLTANQCNAWQEIERYLKGE